MKKFKFIGVSLLTVYLSLVFQTGCTQKGDELVSLVQESLPKTVMLTVFTVVDGYKITVDGDQLKIEKSKVLVQFRGTGVYISPTGHILTCAHMVEEGDVQTVLITEYNGTMMKADILYSETSRDLALLKVNTNSPYIKLADPRSLKVGQAVLAIGNPLGMDFSVSHGIISALNRDSLGVYNMTQSDTFINPGNSGGPLINMRGELVGINSRVLPPVNGPIFTGLGFSVNVGQILEFLTRFKGLDKAFDYHKGVWQGFFDAIGIKPKKK